MIGRELAGRFVRALLIKGGYELREVSDLVPTLPALELEQSAWPPHRPWHALSQQAAVVGQLSATMIFHELTAAPQSRLVVDEIDITSGETQFLLTNGFVGQNTGWTLYSRASLLDVSEDRVDPVQAGLRPVLQDASTYVTSSVAGLGFAAQQRIMYGTANSLTRISRRYPLAVLAPGQGFCIEALTANVILWVGWRGRYFPG